MQYCQVVIVTFWDSQRTPLLVLSRFLFLFWFTLISVIATADASAHVCWYHLLTLISVITIADCSAHAC